MLRRTRQVIVIITLLASIFLATLTTVSAVQFLGTGTITPVSTTTAPTPIPLPF